YSEFSRMTFCSAQLLIIWFLPIPWMPLSCGIRHRWTLVLQCCVTHVLHGFLRRLRGLIGFLYTTLGSPYSKASTVRRTPCPPRGRTGVEILVVLTAWCPSPSGSVRLS